MGQTKIKPQKRDLKLVRRTHKYLLQKSEWYKKWHFHLLTGLSSFSGLVILALVFIFVKGVLASSAWVQTDWSGGIGTSTTTQYSAGTSVNTANVGDARISATAGWFDTNWSYRRKITFNNTTANLGVTSENLTNFPVAVELTSSNFDYSKAQSAGQDIRFKDPDGTDLAYQIEKWNPSGTSLVWVKVPQIDINSSTDYIYMYYGNGSATDHQQASSVWDSNYAGVWHLNEASGSQNDSTSNANNSSSLSLQVQGTATGELGGADTFNGTSNNIVVPQSSSLNIAGSAITLDAWISVNNCGSANAFIHKDVNYTLALMDGGTTCALSYADGSSWSYAAFGNWGSIPKNGSWHHVVATKSGSTVSLYLDNTLLVSQAFGGAITTNTNPLYIGSYVNSFYLNGSEDEVRISDVARSRGYIAAEYKTDTNTFNTYGSEETAYNTSATLTSAIFDGSTPNDWGNLTYNTTSPSGTSISIKVRSGNAADLSDASSFSSCSPINSGSDATSSCAPDKSRYAQYQVTFNSTGAITPALLDVSLGYGASDTVAPPTNASTLLMSRHNGSPNLTSNSWVNTSPYFTWTAGADDAGGSGIKGYCLYLGTDSTADPVTTKGLLGASPLDIGGACQFAVSSNSIDLSTAGYIASAMTSSNSPYYLLIKAIDNANNVYLGSTAQFQFRFDNTQPTNPAFITAPSQFVSSKGVTLTWDTSGGSAPADANSGLAGLQYRIGSSGTWYGDNHNGAQDSSDLLTNDGSYTMQSSPDFANLSDGNNIVYFRTWDATSNISTANVTTVIKLNTASPSSPQNVTSTPTTNTTNSFAFSWLAPASFTGSAANITYCYTVNAAPTSGNCTFTAAGVTSLDAGSYATQPGDNTFYVVAKDEAGNINYATAASTTFTANTPAPGIPLNMEIADVSTKATNSWKLALSWNPPTDIGAGVANYKVFRSTDNSSFAQTASTAGTSVVDTGLSQITYYYKVKACDSANNCGAFSDVLSKLPTGRFTSPANLVSQPSVSNLSTRKATISWATDRDSDSRIQFGTASGQYQSTEAANSDQTTNHVIDLTNLSAGTTYYYVAKWTDTDGNTGTSGEQTFTTLPAPSISGVSAVNVGLSNATIQFTSKSADSVKIYYGKSKDFGAVQSLNTSISESTYSAQLNGLDDGTTYYYKINPFDTDGNEYDQTTLSFTTPARPRISNLRFQPVADQPTSTQQITWDTNVPSSSELDYGPVGETPLTVADATLVTAHQMVISGLIDNKEYGLVAQSRDSAGNLAASDKQIFHTALDTRPPKISAVKVTSSIKGTGSEAGGQIIVSWKTDEPASSQVGYGVGSGTTYANSTAEDDTLVLDHVVIISNLPTSQIFHLQALSKDASNNLARSQNYSAIVGDASDNVLSIVFNALQKVFGF